MMHRCIHKAEDVTVSPSRRQLLAGALFAVPALTWHPEKARAQRDQASAERRLHELESAHGGRLGVAILDLSSGALAGNRLNERFLLCSTFKTLLVAFILDRVDRGDEKLDRRIAFSKSDLVDWSPVTETRAGSGMTVAELCEATVTLSDNTAANLLLASFGGPPELTNYLRGLGDQVTRLDRIEPALNQHDGPGDLRDTTTPAAMVETLRTLFASDALSPRSRSQLAAWHITNKTGDERLRAGFPKHWLVGDKTGTNGSGNANDVAIAWPPDRGMVIVGAYCEMPSLSAKARDAVLAEAGRIAASL